MKIAVTSQNRKTITQHAGKCRKFWIYDINEGAIAGKDLLELPIEQSFHASHHQLAAPLAGVSVLITASMGAGLYQRLRQGGITPFITTEEDPDTAVAAYLEAGQEPPHVEYASTCPEHGHHHSHR